MDKYSHWLPRIIGLGCPWAITLGQTAYYSVPENVVSSGWRQHEDTHKVQWARDGWLKFSIMYVYYLVRRGYRQNPYEIEARGTKDERE